MVLFPKIGGRYWIVTDIWERFVSIPVLITGKGDDGTFVASWRLSNDCIQRFDGLRRKGMFRRNARAYRAACRLNKKGDAR